MAINHTAIIHVINAPHPYLISKNCIKSFNHYHHHHYPSNIILIIASVSIYNYTLKIIIIHLNKIKDHYDLDF